MSVEVIEDIQVGQMAFQPLTNVKAHLTELDIWPRQHTHFHLPPQLLYDIQVWTSGWGNNGREHVLYYTSVTILYTFQGISQ